MLFFFCLFFFLFDGFVPSFRISFTTVIVFITPILKSLVILAIRLALNSAIYSQTAPFFCSKSHQNGNEVTKNRILILTMMLCDFKISVIKWQLNFESNQTRAARSFDFEIMRMISDQIALHSVQLPLLIFV